MVDMMLVGQLGDTAVAAVGLASQVYFILSLLYFGMSSGSAIFTAQFWGKQDKGNIQKVLTLNIISNLTIGILFTLLAQIAPGFILRLFSNDPDVILLGSQYLRIYSLGYVFLGFSYAFYTVLRSTENVKIPMGIGITILSMNTLLGYTLIFGKFGIPALGINGAAIANASARFIELMIIFAILNFRKSAVVIKPKLDFSIRPDFVKRYFSTAMPVTVNELIWSLGIAVYNSIYAHIGTESITAINIASTVENLAFVPFIGLGNAAAILIGKDIGANEMKEGIDQAKRIIKISCATAVVMGGLIFLNRTWILDIYKISEAAQSYAHLILIAVSVIFLVKSTSFSIIIGILRAGGDTRFGLLIELATMWLFGVPAAYLAANVFHLPVYWVVVVVAFEEVLKLILITLRFKSRKWVHHLTHPFTDNLAPQGSPSSTDNG